jgi:hypothetical protein|tara:strand:- start:240 stop:485 length:246 start_codon:yes stop_codon:yes gene_type:complete
MAETTFTYATWEERQEIVVREQAASRWMKHDEIRDGVNTLIFDEPLASEPIEPTRKEELLAIGKDNWTDAQQKELIEILAG